MCLLMSGQTSSDIKYLCVYDNRYIRYFRGHTMGITSLSMNPVNDMFISASNDETIRLWDLSSPNSLGKVNLPPNHYGHHIAYHPPLCSFDSTGLVFGVLHNSSLKLFDSRNYSNGPFENIFPKHATLKKSMLNTNESLTETQISRFLTAPWTDFEFR
jgi:COMPASS component SWD2